MVLRHISARGSATSSHVHKNEICLGKENGFYVPNDIHKNRSVDQKNVSNYAIRHEMPGSHYPAIMKEAMSLKIWTRIEKHTPASRNPIAPVYLYLLSCKTPNPSTLQY